MTIKTYRSLYVMLEYLENEEKKHYEESGQPESHIYRDIERVREWLDDISCKTLRQDEPLLDAIKACSDCKFAPCAEHTK